jgi:preprotein translocase subunit YajC
MPFATDSIHLLTAGGGGGLTAILMQVAPFLLIFVVFYFLLIRPQQQRMKAHRDMVAALRKGDEVITQGGLIGKVTRVGDVEATVELAEGVRVKIIRSTIAEVRTRTEPANDSADDKDA